MAWRGMRRTAAAMVCGWPVAAIVAATAARAILALPLGSLPAGEAPSSASGLTPRAGSMAEAASGPTASGDLVLAQRRVPRAASPHSARRSPPAEMPRPLPMPRREIDESAAAAEGIRRIDGRHLILYTDLPASDSIDSLVEVFDRAFPLWCDYFGLNARELAGWGMRGYLMGNRQAFLRSGLLPEDLPPFPNGYSRHDELWLYEQGSDYYRRHLLLHEGVHGFMNAMLGGCGPPWYEEGMAEYLATHRWERGRLVLPWMPTDADAVAGWGRIGMIRGALESGRRFGLREVIEFPPEVFRESEPYAWSWATVAYLEADSRYRERFRTLPALVTDPHFNARFFDLFADDWEELAERWAVFVAELDYNYDFARNDPDLASGRPLASAGVTVAVAADRGWQNSGLALAAGQSYRLRAAGRFQVGNDPQIWWSEPNGVSIRYYRGRPLGELLAAIRCEDGEFPSGLVNPLPVGLGSELTASGSGTLYFKINHAPGERHTAAGGLHVRIEPIAE